MRARALDGERDRPGHVVALVPTADQGTDRARAARPERDARYRRPVEHLKDQPIWDDAARIGDRPDDAGAVAG